MLAESHRWWGWGEAPLFIFPRMGRAQPKHSPSLFKPRARFLERNQAQKEFLCELWVSRCARSMLRLPGCWWCPWGGIRGGCWECSRSEVPVQQRSLSSSPPRVSPSRFWPTSPVDHFSSSVVTPSHSPFAQPARFSSSLWQGCNYLNCSL